MTRSRWPGSRAHATRWATRALPRRRWGERCTSGRRRNGRRWLIMQSTGLRATVLTRAGAERNYRAMVGQVQAGNGQPFAEPALDARTHGTRVSSSSPRRNVSRLLCRNGRGTVCAAEGFSRSARKREDIEASSRGQRRQRRANAGSHASLKDQWLATGFRNARLSVVRRLREMQSTDCAHRQTGSGMGAPRSGRSRLRFIADSKVESGASKRCRRGPAAAEVARVATIRCQRKTRDGRGRGISPERRHCSSARRPRTHRSR